MHGQKLLDDTRQKTGSRLQESETQSNEETHGRLGMMVGTQTRKPEGRLLEEPQTDHTADALQNAERRFAVRTERLQVSYREAHGRQGGWQLRGQHKVTREGNDVVGESAAPLWLTVV